ncbi:MAG: PIN domain-containing protein [Actinobacteria bacterium]|nr:PIN domain-containing protein [Actinomycetota bacterium]
MIILDTSALYAYFRADDPDHVSVVDVMNSGRELVVSPYVVAELDYLLTRRAGTRAEIRMLAELSSGAFELPVLGAGDLITCAEVIGRFPDQSIGVTDASLVVLADRYATNRIATFDHRHFSVLRSLTGGAFELLPA